MCAGCGVYPCALCVCMCIGVCASARAHVFTLPEITSFLGLPSLHPEVFNDPSTRLNKTKQRTEQASAGSALAELNARSGRTGLGCRSQVLDSRSPSASSRRCGAADTAGPCVTPGTRPWPREEENSLQNSNGSEKRITTKY